MITSCACVRVIVVKMAGKTDENDNLTPLSEYTNHLLLTSILNVNIIALNEIYGDLLRISAHWKEFGLCLGISLVEIRELAYSVAGEQDKVSFCFTRVIQNWLDNDGKKEKLVKAIRVLGSANLAEKLESDSMYNHVYNNYVKQKLNYALYNSYI